MAPLFVLAQRGRIFEIIAFAYMVATIFLVLLESLRPKVSFGKSLCPSRRSGSTSRGLQNRISAIESRLAALQLQTLQ
jgi:hypothetical protein